MSGSISGTSLSIILSIFLLLNVLVSVYDLRSKNSFLAKVLVLLFIWAIPIIGMLLSFFLIKRDKNKTN
jgi:hypothetical protein